MSGFGGESQRPAVQDVVAFPTFAELFQPRAQKSLLTSPPRAIGEVRYTNRAPLDARAAATTNARSASKPAASSNRSGPRPLPASSRARCRTTTTARSPSMWTPWPRRCAPSTRRSSARGMVLQIDGPDLAMERHRLFADRPLAEFLDFVDVTVAALNRALRNVPPERVRLHVCWGNYEGPHIFDVPLEDLAPHLYAARVGGLVLSMANPRHAHEHRILAKQPAAARLDDRGRRHRHHHELRRASRGGRRPHRARRRARSAIRTASSPAPIAASTPPRDWARSPRRWCGRSCARCARARRSRRAGCSRPGHSPASVVPAHAGTQTPRALLDPACAGMTAGR